MSNPSPATNIKQQIMISVNSLPPDGLKELVTFLDYMRFKFKDSSPSPTPYKPVALGGLWKNESIDEQDITEIRREMWHSFGNQEL